MLKIALIDEDRELCSTLEEYFCDEGFQVASFPDGAGGFETALAERWDLIILDVCLSDGSGFDLLSELRDASSVPVLILTGRSDAADIVVGLEMGADDYLIKPFNFQELLARIRALIRRSNLSVSASSTDNKTLIARDLSVCTGTRRAEVGGRPVRLTSAEFTILQMLLEAEGGLVNREDISRIALNRELSPFDRSIDVHISNLRRKLGPAAGGGGRITTVRGAGYIYTDLDSPEASIMRADG